MERYAITIHKDSGIKNDPNDWSDDPALHRRSGQAHRARERGKRADCEGATGTERGQMIYLGARDAIPPAPTF